MKWLLLGALLGLCLVYPPLMGLLVAAVAAVLSKPLLVAFVAGLAVRSHLPRMQRYPR
jgi:hypothetical protein